MLYNTIHQVSICFKYPICKCTYTSDGDVGAPALRDGDLVGGAGRAHVRPARPGRRQPEGEGGRRRRGVLDPAPTRLLPEANAATIWCF